MPELLTWNQISETDEFIDDFALLQSVSRHEVGNDEFAESQAEFIYIICKLAAITRYLIRHQGELRDIDLAPDKYLNYLKQEIGFGLPTASAFPIREFLRESRNWFRAKGSEKLFDFIGELVGSPIVLHYPKDLIFTLDDPRSCLDGAESGGLVLSWDESCLAMLHDGVYWAKYVYIVDVLQAQNIKFESDLLGLLNAVHPAGTKRYIREFFNYFVAKSLDEQPKVILSNEKFIDFSLVVNNAPQFNLDGHFILDDPNSLLDGLNFDSGTLNTISIREIQRIDVVPCYRTLARDTMLHNFPEGQNPPDTPNLALSRFVFDESIQDFVEKFADNDDIVYENVTTNVGLNNYTLGQLSGFTARHLMFAAFDLEGKNKNLTYMPDYLPIKIEETA